MSERGIAYGIGATVVYTCASVLFAVVLGAWCKLVYLAFVWGWGLV